MAMDGANPLYKTTVDSPHALLDGGLAAFDDWAARNNAKDGPPPSFNKMKNGRWVDTAGPADSEVRLTGMRHTAHCPASCIDAPFRNSRYEISKKPESARVHWAVGSGDDAVALSLGIKWSSDQPRATVHRPGGDLPRSAGDRWPR